MVTKKCLTSAKIWSADQDRLFWSVDQGSDLQNEKTKKSQSLITSSPSYVILVVVPQQRLNTFLAAAEDLEILGLSKKCANIHIGDLGTLSK